MFHYYLRIFVKILSNYSIVELGKCYNVDMPFKDLKGINNVKKVHGIIDAKCLKPLAKLPGVKKVVPGFISWRKKTSAIKAGLYFQRITSTGLKLAIKGNMYVQDIVVIIDPQQFDLRELQKVVQNPHKVLPE